MAPGRPCAAAGGCPGRWPFRPPRRRKRLCWRASGNGKRLAALRRLPPRQREVVVLRYFADLPEQETAVAMGVSCGTVKSTTSRALAALARMLQEEEP